jgi:two-component sensor histidine kinase
MDENDAAFMDLLPQLIGFTGADLRSRFVNSAYASFLGKSKAELRGASLEVIWGRDVAEELRPFIGRALKGESLSFTRELKSAAGPARAGKVDLVPAEGGGYFSVISDGEAIGQSLSDRNNLIHELDHRVNNILQVLHSVIALEMQAADDHSLRTLAAFKSRLDALALSYEYLKYPRPEGGWEAEAILEKIAASIGPGMSATSKTGPGVFISPGDLDAFIFIATELSRWASSDEATVMLEAHLREEGIELSVSNGRDCDLTSHAGAAGIALVESFAQSRKAGPLRGGSRLTMIFPQPTEANPSE